jgi:hypothetical protein
LQSVSYFTESLPFFQYGERSNTVMLHFPESGWRVVYLSGKRL